MDEQSLREYYLKDILAAKHYPQVLRVTRPYLVEGREYLKKGQYITVLERRRIELLTGTDKEKRPFKVRNDRSAIVEVLEQHRIAHSLAEVAGISNYVIGIEICRELRFDKITFYVGERLTIEKIGKSFRGRMKNINLKRERDGKVYRLPLDVIGSFKLIPGKTKLPVTKLMNSRALPISAQFRNTPLSNFPSGIVNVQDKLLCDIVYILTVQEESYTYEAFSIESNVYVEKCNLKLPKPVRKLVPDGIYVNSSDFMPHKQKYKEKLFDIDSNLIEDIYAPGYYGSATYEKNQLLDEHLVDYTSRKRISATLSLDETYDHAMRTLSEYSSNASTPDSDKSNTLPSSKKPPEVLPRHSKNRQREKRQTMTAIHEFEWSQPAGLVQKSLSDSNIIESGNAEISTASHLFNRHLSSADYSDAETRSLDLPSNVGTGSNRSTCSTRSRLSDRFEGHPSKIFTPLEDHEVYYQASPNKDRLAGRIYEVPNGPVPKIHSPSSSIATEDSGDSGVGVFYPSTPFYQSKQQFPEDENVYTYTLPLKTNEQNSTTIVRKTLPAAAAPQYNGEQNVHKVHVDIDISSDANNNSIGLPSQGVQRLMPPPLQPRIPTQEMPNHQPDDYVNSTFANEAVENKKDEIRGLTQENTGVLLKCLNLGRYVPIFNSELINGDLLLILEEQTLVSDLGMTHFDARKLFRYVHGWRPVICYTDESDVDSDPVHWSVNTVVSELLKIKLPLLARFCKDNYIDGSLLVEMSQCKLVETLKDDHGIALSGIELSRLRAFVLKKWKPDPMQLPENPRRISQHERSFSASVTNINTSSQSPRQQHQHKLASHSNSSLSLNNMASQERGRLNSAEKKKSNSLWNRIKAV